MSQAQCPYKKRLRELAPSLGARSMERHGGSRRERGHLQPGWKLLARNQACWQPDLGLPASRAGVCAPARGARHGGRAEEDSCELLSGCSRCPVLWLTSTPAVPHSLVQPLLRPHALQGTLRPECVFLTSYLLHKAEFQGQSGRTAQNTFNEGTKGSVGRTAVWVSCPEPRLRSSVGKCNRARFSLYDRSSHVLEMVSLLIGILCASWLLCHPRLIFI